MQPIITYKQSKFLSYELQPFLCRGTKDFEVQVSDNKVVWTTVVTGTLRDARQDHYCGETPLQRFSPTTGTAKGRYIKFIAKNAYGLGAGLQYFNIVHYDKKEGDLIMQSYLDYSIF